MASLGHTGAQAPQLMQSEVIWVAIRLSRQAPSYLGRVSRAVNCSCGSCFYKCEKREMAVATTSFEMIRCGLASVCRLATVRATCSIRLVRSSFSFPFLQRVPQHRAARHPSAMIAASLRTVRRKATGSVIRRNLVAIAPSSIASPTLVLRRLSALPSISNSILLVTIRKIGRDSNAHSA